MPRLRLAKDLQPSHGYQVRELLQARDLPLARVLLSEAREAPLKLRGNSLSPSSSRNHLQEALARSLQVAKPSSRGLLSPLGSSHREGHNRELLASRVVLEHPPPSNPDLLPKAREAQEDDPHCSKSLSPHRSQVKTVRLWAALHN